ncbi:MAG TPA: hypothetical protein VGL03_07875 [Thermoanaerobaculia bacterium]|jgi:hypothetical protein
MKRLLLLLIVAGVVTYLVKSQALFHSGTGEAEGRAPIDRARAVARASDARAAAGEAVSREADQPAGAAVTENMTPEQVRSLLGPPDDVAIETTGSGASRETWTYRSVGKSVVFENGIVVEVH